MEYILFSKLLSLSSEKGGVKRYSWPPLFSKGGVVDPLDPPPVSAPELNFGIQTFANIKYDYDLLHKFCNKIKSGFI